MVCGWGVACVGCGCGHSWWFIRFGFELRSTLVWRFLVLVCMFSFVWMPRLFGQGLLLVC